jgi:hypothetical protein
VNPIIAPIKLAKSRVKVREIQTSPECRKRRTPIHMNAFETKIAEGPARLFEPFTFIAEVTA